MALVTWWFRVSLTHREVIFHILNICKKMSLLFKKENMYFFLNELLKNIYFQIYKYFKKFEYYSLYSLSSFHIHWVQNVYYYVSLSPLLKV